jgi:MoaA/NifB/PqqE/SkfB family radical SAM enzyme
MKQDISFNWDIHWACNYRCPYCWFYGKWDEVAGRNVYHSLEKLLMVWERIFDRYGQVKVAITGGEPFHYPNFADFIVEASQWHHFMIITNLSTDITAFIHRVRRDAVVVNPSFHPLSADVDDFIGKARVLKEAGLLQCITYLAWPPLIEKIPHFQEQFARHGLTLTLQSFFGEYRGITYPDGYTEQEKMLIMPHLGSRGEKKFQTEAMRTRGKQCRAGQVYGVIHPDGTVRRCGGINSQDAVVGNLFDDNFALLAGSLPCTSETCPCNEWAFLLDSDRMVDEA